MNHEGFETAKAIMRLQSLLTCREELLEEYPEIAADLAIIRKQCDVMLKDFEQNPDMRARIDDFQVIEQMEYLLLELDTQCRNFD